jgi:hypothetical protein
MKKLVYGILCGLLIIGGAAYAFESYGNSSLATYTTTSDTAVSFATAFSSGGGTLLSDQPPKAVTLSSEDNTVRFSFVATPTVDNVGVLLAEGGSMRWPSPNAYADGKICPGSTGVNAKIHLILEW